MREEQDPICGGAHLADDRALVRVDHLRQEVALFHLVAALLHGAVNTGGAALHVHHVVLVDDGTHVPAMAAVLDYPHARKEPQHR